MKKKKDADFKIPKMRKRKSFCRVFGEKWLWVMAVWGVSGAVCLAALVNDEKSEKMDTFYDVINAQETRVSDTRLEEIDNFARREQFQAAVLMESHGIAVIVYDTESYEQIAGCEEQIFVIKSATDTEPAKIFSCPTASIAGWAEHRAGFEGKTKKLAMYTEGLEVDKFYIDGNELILGDFKVSVTEIDLLDYSMAVNGYEPNNLFESVIKGPIEVPEGYTVYEYGKDDFVIQPLVIGYSDTSCWKRLQPCADESYALMRDTYEKGERYSSQTLETAFTLSMVYPRKTELENGQQITILGAMYYDFFEVWGRIVAGVACGMLILGTVFAFVLAKLSYSKMKAQYDMEDYRINLMNTMAHDLKSPLMSISGYAENLENNMNPGKQEHYARAIQENVQYMNSMIESILNLSKMEQGRVRLKSEQVDIGKVVRDCVAQYERRLQEKDLTVQVQGTADWQADSILMTQILDNLISNAVKYSQNGGVIKMEVLQNRLEIVNPCETNLSESIYSLCDPFVVGDESRGNKKGNGLGLAIVRQICELQGFEFEIRYAQGQFYAIVKKFKNKKMPGSL